MKKSLIALTAGAALFAAVPATASAATRQFEGTVVSVDRDARSFRLHDREAGTKRIRVTAATRFERVSGLSGLHKGQRNIEVTVRRSGGRWIALKVERSGGGGAHRGDDRGGDDRGGSGHGGGGRDHPEDD